MIERDGGELEPIRVLVVDDQELFRRGITMLLANEPGIQVVGEAGDGIEGTQLAVTTMPDVVLLDVRMPKRTGIEACLAIKEAVPSAKIVMLTVSDEEGDLYEAVKSGASPSSSKKAEAQRCIGDDTCERVHDDGWRWWRWRRWRRWWWRR